ncbi:MAG: CHASE2 domain-containing protein [Acidobacteriota bacterium]
MRRRLFISMAGLLALAVLIFLAWSGLAQHGNAAAADMLLRLDHRRLGLAPQNVILLAIDDETVERYGPLPIDRAALADALNRVASAAPSVLVVDMLLSEKTTPAADARLADAFQRFPSVVLATALEIPADGRPSRWLKPLPEFESHAMALGHVHIEPDPDGVARTLLLAKSDGDQRYWALGFEAFRARLGVQGLPIESANALRVGTHRVPAANVNDRLLWIHYAGPEGTFQHVSLARVLEGQVPISVFAGKVVILGVTAQGAGDRVFTPFSTGLGMSGIEIHANVFRTLADGAYLIPLSPPAELLSILAIAALIAAAVWWRQGRFLIPVAISGVVLIPVLSYAMFRGGVIVPAASWIVVQITASLMALLVHTLFVRRRLREAIVGQQDYAFRLQAVAHEIKTPLTAIHASSQLMTEAAIPERKKEEIAQRIHTESGRLSGVVTTFLDVERIAAGVLKLERQQADLARIAADASERAALLALKKNIAIEQDLEFATVAADPGLLQFALYNLLVNAIKFSPESSTVRITLRSDSQFARLEVSDQGCGIEPAEQKHIFERFYRAKPHDGEQPGSGVGLALVKEIVTQHGGRVEVSSEPGKGSRFTVILPRKVTE